MSSVRSHFGSSQAFKLVCGLCSCVLLHDTMEDTKLRPPPLTPRGSVSPRLTPRGSVAQELPKVSDSSGTGDTSGFGGRVTCSAKEASGQTSSVRQKERAPISGVLQPAWVLGGAGHLQSNCHRLGQGSSWVHVCHAVAAVLGCCIFVGAGKAFPISSVLRR